MNMQFNVCERKIFESTCNIYLKTHEKTICEYVRGQYQGMVTSVQDEGVEYYKYATI